jgi:hypothetical protein
MHTHIEKAVASTKKFVHTRLHIAVTVTAALGTGTEQAERFRRLPQGARPVRRVLERPPKTKTDSITRSHKDSGFS